MICFLKFWTMSLALNDLLICCRQLEHDRATERRVVNYLNSVFPWSKHVVANPLLCSFFYFQKEVEKFKCLIRDPETVQHLDRHSDSKQGKYLNWDAVFRYSILIFLLYFSLIFISVVILWVCVFRSYLSLFSI